MFGATGFLGRYIVNRLGTSTKLQTGCVNAGLIHYSSERMHGGGTIPRRDGEETFEAYRRSWKSRVLGMGRILASYTDQHLAYTLDLTGIRPSQYTVNRGERETFRCGLQSCWTNVPNQVRF